MKNNITVIKLIYNVPLAQQCIVDCISIGHRISIVHQYSIFFIHFVFYKQHDSAPSSKSCLFFHHFEAQSFYKLLNRKWKKTKLPTETLILFSFLVCGAKNLVDKGGNIQ